MERVLFFTTAGCHLCDQALEIWSGVASPAWTIEMVEIADDDALVDLYGERIPVFKRQDTGAELGWPLGYHDLVRFLE